MSTVKIQLDDELLTRIGQHAAASGGPRDEIIAEAVRKQLDGGRLRQILASARERSDLDEDEAMRVAIAEERADRAERTADAGQVPAPDWSTSTPTSWSRPPSRRRALPQR